MAVRSILELDEAIQRLEGMARDHERFAELLAKLAEVRDKLQDRLSEAEGRSARVQDQLANATRGAGELRRMLEQFSSDTTAAINGFKAASESSIGQLCQARESLLAEVERELSALGNRQSDWEQQQQASFDEFRTEHSVALDQVTKAYDRMRVTYDSMRMSADALEGEVAELRTAVGAAAPEERVDEIQRDLRERTDAQATKLARLSESLQERQAAVETNVQSAVAELRDAMTDYVGQVERSTAGGLEEMREQQEACGRSIKGLLIGEVCLAVAAVGAFVVWLLSRL